MPSEKEVKIFIKKEISPSTLFLRAIEMLLKVYLKNPEDRVFAKKYKKLLDDAATLVSKYEKKEEPEEGPNALEGMKRVTVKLPKPSEELKPWMGLFTGEPVELYDRAYPYAKDGFIDREGHFFQCDALRHAQFSYMVFKVSPDYLTDICGWVAVWSFESMFNKDGETTEKFRWSKKPSKSQITTMLDWCRGQKIDLKVAFGQHKYKEIFGEEK